MAAVNQNKTDDFFRLLEKEQQIENPFTSDEILFRDEAGNLKILKSGEVLDFKEDQGAGKRQSIEVKLSPENKAAGLSETKLSPSPVWVKKGLTAATLTKVARPLNIDKEVNFIIKQSGANLSDTEDLRRFKNIISSRLKEVRDQIQVREMLLSSPLVGGMGFDAATADRVLAVINQEFERFTGDLRSEVSQELFSELRAEAKKILEQPLPAPKPKFEPKEKPEPAVKISAVEKSKPVEFFEPLVFSRPIMAPLGQAGAATAKPKVLDVKFKPKLIGPVEEIRSMTLTDFRRLAPSPALAIEKILEKIDLLEEESFIKKTQAIKAWKENEINQLYLKLGEQSMEEKKFVSQIITERQAANQPTLTEEEVEAVIKLNQRLRF